MCAASPSVRFGRDGGAEHPGDMRPPLMPSDATRVSHPPVRHAPASRNPVTPAAAPAARHQGHPRAVPTSPGAPPAVRRSRPAKAPGPLTAIVGQMLALSAPPTEPDARRAWDALAGELLLEFQHRYAAHDERRALAAGA